MYASFAMVALLGLLICHPVNRVLLNHNPSTPTKKGGDLRHFEHCPYTISVCLTLLRWCVYHLFIYSHYLSLHLPHLPPSFSRCLLLYIYSSLCLFLSHSSLTASCTFEQNSFRQQVQQTCDLIMWPRTHTRLC